LKSVILAPLHRPEDAVNLAANIERQSIRADVIVVENGPGIDSYKGRGKVLRIDSKGVGAARNACIEAAREDGQKCFFFFFFDADDYYGPDYVRGCLNFLIRNPVSAAGRSQGWTILSDGLYRFDHVETILPSGGTLMGVLADALPFPEDVVIGEDHAWWQAMIAAGKSVALTGDQRDYCYIRHSHNTYVMDETLFRLGRGPVHYYGKLPPEAISGTLEAIETRPHPSNAEVMAALKRVGSRPSLVY